MEENGFVCNTGDSEDPGLGGGIKQMKLSYRRHQASPL